MHTTTTQAQGTQGTQAGTGSQPATPATQPLPTWAQHGNPQVAKLLAKVANGSAKVAKYGSAAAMCRAHGITAKAHQREVRQVLRDAGMGVGRGRTYNGNVVGQVRKAAQANAKRNAAQAKG